MITSFPGRVIYAIDRFLFLFGLYWIIVKIHLKLPDFELRKVGRIDNNFVGIFTIFSYNADSRLRFFLILLGGIRIDFAY
jgi:hypothetical protein